MTAAPNSVIASINATSLSSQDYLAHLTADAARLREVATDLAAPVPSCPDWSVADLVGHVAAVYAHKTAALRSGAHPGPGEWATAAPDGMDVRDWFDAELAALIAELETRDPMDHVWTWWPPDQSVGFWYRRMAQETLVHRWDAELAAGSTTAMDPALATDGVDEVLGWLGWELDEPVDDAEGQVVLVRCNGFTWSVRLEPTRAVVTAAVGGPDTGDASVEGAPEPLLLHLWGRGRSDEVTHEGNPQTLRRLTQRLAHSTD